jgi:hypothetical protein
VLPLQGLRRFLRLGYLGLTPPGYWLPSLRDSVWVRHNGVANTFFGVTVRWTFLGNRRARFPRPLAWAVELGPVGAGMRMRRAAVARSEGAIPHGGGVRWASQTI